MRNAPALTWLFQDAIVHPRAGAPAFRGSVTVRDGRVTGATAGAAAGAGLPVVGGAGLHVYPGFTDAHAHLRALGRHLEEVRLEGAQSLGEALSRVRERARQLAPGEWVTGRGWSPDEWRDGGQPTAAVLDEAAEGRAVALQRRDGHSVWVSSEVLRRAGIDARTPAPDGGRIERDSAGLPTGILVDRAMSLLDPQLPRPDAAATRRHLLAAQADCVRVGLTGIHDMGLDSETLRALHELDAAGELRLRVYGALDGGDERLSGDLTPHATGGPAAPLTVRAIKLFADGALGSRSAWLLEPYADDPGNSGLCLTAQDELRARIRAAAAAGFQCCIHAIGDAANRAVLDAYEAVLGPNHATRPRIEHAQVVAPEDRERYAALGVLASMQPIHCTSDMQWARQRLGPERGARAYSWRSLRAAGTRLAFGSDLPIETHDPCAGLYAAVTRRNPGDPTSVAWEPSERLPLAEALAAYTEGAAYARFAERDLGTIAVGALADFTIFDRALDERDPDGLLQARVAATVVGGRVVYAADIERWGIAGT